MKSIEYDTKGNITFITSFRYYDTGLLKEEEAYRNGEEFAYRFVTTYK